MLGNKYSKFLTIFLIVLVVVIAGLGIFFIVKSTKQSMDEKNLQSSSEKDLARLIEEAKKQEIVISDDNTQNQLIEDNTNNTDENNNNEDDPLNVQPNTNNNQNTNSSSSSNTNKNKYQYRGYNYVGILEIPKNNKTFYILEKVSKSSIEVSVAMLYGPGPNKEGTTLIIGHNYRNTQFFSKNKNLSIGDKIYVTDLSGKRLAYTIYDKFETTENDISFVKQDTNGARIVSLSTCTDDGANRLILMAKCDEDR